MKASICFVILLTGSVIAADAPKGDQEKLQGSWRVVTMENNGKPEPAAATKEARLVFEENRYTLKGGQEDYRGTFMLDPGQKPKAIDTTFVAEGGDQGKAVGIYKLEGNQLTICWRHGEKNRPTEFASKPGSGNRLIVVQRD